MKFLGLIQLSYKHVNFFLDTPNAHESLVHNELESNRRVPRSVKRKKNNKKKCPSLQVAGARSAAHTTTQRELFNERRSAIR